MPVGKKVTIIGAGSLRAAAPVLASLFNFPLTPENRIALCDVEDEVLDLVDRLARSFAVAQDVDVIITATTDPAEAIEDADTVILAFGAGRRREELEGLEGEPGELARALLMREPFERVNDLLYSLRTAPRVVNLVRPISMSAQLMAHEAFHLEWPAALSSEERIPVAHQILRWVRGDEPLFGPLKEFAESPLVTALSSGLPPPENRFNPRAVSGWAALLEEKQPGVARKLLAAD